MFADFSPLSDWKLVKDNKMKSTINLNKNLDTSGVENSGKHLRKGKDTIQQNIKQIYSRF